MASPRDIAYQIHQWIAQSRSPERKGKDRFPVFADDPLKAVQLDLNEYATQMLATVEFWKLKPSNFPKGKELLNRSPAEKAQLVRALLIRVATFADELSRQPT